MENWEIVGRHEVSGVSESRFLLYKLYDLEQLNLSLLLFFFLSANMDVDEDNYFIDCNEN